MAAMTNGKGRIRIPWRIIGWSILGVLMLLPLVAMQFTDEVNWTASDFVFAGVLFGSVGLTFELIVRRSRSLAYRLGAAIAVVGAFLTIWVNAAVGMIGSEDNPYNLLFLGGLLLALVGAVIARFRSAGMARAMAIAGIAQAAVSAFGISTDFRGGVLSMGFSGLWLLPAALFRIASRPSTQTRQ
ncbi:MAG TPA: hypothetical protein VGR19_02090 [Allosphingosinicella sp.]|nr:hypothetical protein [Allosphingosinicella sp.]